MGRARKTMGPTAVVLAFFLQSKTENLDRRPQHEVSTQGIGRAILQPRLEIKTWAIVLSSLPFSLSPSLSLGVFGRPVRGASIAQGAGDTMVSKTDTVSVLRITYT